MVKQILYPAIAMLRPQIPIYTIKTSTWSATIFVESIKTILIQPISRTTDAFSLQPFFWNKINLYQQQHKSQVESDSTASFI